MSLFSSRGLSDCIFTPARRREAESQQRVTELPSQRSSIAGRLGLAGVAAAALTALALASTSAPSEPAVDETERRALDAYGKLPLSFVPNRGQTDKRVRYYAQGPGFGFYLTADKAVLSFTKGERGTALELRFAGANPDARLEAGRARRRARSTT